MTVERHFPTRKRHHIPPLLKGAVTWALMLALCIAVYALAGGLVGALAAAFGARMPWWLALCAGVVAVATPCMAIMLVEARHAPTLEEER